MAVYCLTALAQPPNRYEEQREKYRSMKIAYFTENLDLTPEEAQKFWPVYNNYENQKHQLMKNRRLRTMELNNNMDNLSEKEAEEIIDRHMQARQKELDVEMEFHKELKKILSPKKIMKLYITEVEFREYMLKQIRQDHPGAGRRRGR
jgi:Spy/CpxP family protein refolding chaperone